MRARSLAPCFTLSALGALFIALAPGCVPEFEDDLAAIDARKVLAVQAEPAEIPADGQTRLTALIAAPLGEDERPEDLSWALCVARKPLTELGPVSQECVDAFGTESESLEPLGEGAAVTAAVSTNVCSAFGPLPPVGSSGEAEGRPVDPDVTGGYYQPLLVGDDAVSLGQVRLSCQIPGITKTQSDRYVQSYRPNENPEILKLELVDGDGAREVPPRSSGQRVEVAAGSKLELRAVWPACPREPSCGDGLCTAGEYAVGCQADCQIKSCKGDACAPGVCGDGVCSPDESALSCKQDCRPLGCTGSESYVWVNPRTRTVEPRREGLALAWYATAGKFDGEQTGRSESDPDGTDTTNGWRAPKTPGPVRIWTVLRDDRGGVGWQIYDVDVVAP